MQREIARQLEMLRSFEESSPEALPSARSAFFSNLPNENGPPLSPRQMPHDESRRGSLASTSNNRLTPFRPPPPSHLTVSPRRYGSIGASSSYSPSSARAPVQPPPPPPPSMQHPLVSITSPGPPSNLPRRHTSADIRLHGWQPGIGQGAPPSQSPFASGHNSVPWPSSPHRAPIGGDAEIRNALASYDIRGSTRGSTSRAASPPPPDVVQPPPSASASYAGSKDEAGWQLPGARYPFKGIDTSAPPTRRSSMASNVHSLLNPAETAERPEESEDGGGIGGSKRKRVQ